MWSRTTVGALLFSSVVVLSVANGHFSFASMLRRHTPQLRSRPEENDEVGELVTADTVAYRLSLWRLCASKNSKNEGDSSCELEIVNELDDTVLLCWVDPDRELKHYRPLNDQSIKDKSVSNIHVEYTRAKHHFVCIRNIEPLPATLRDIRDECFIFSYVPLKSGVRHCITLASDAGRPSLALCGAAKDLVKVSLRCIPLEEAGDVIDSSSKHYDQRMMCGFTVYYEPGVFEVPGFESAFLADVAQLSCLLPDGACARLQKDTPIYVNKSLTYGTTKKPVQARGCCYHPRGGTDWLRKNGLNVCKEGCIEVFSAEGYLRSRDHWGVGGVLVHEFSHVYHDKHCRDGYDCEEIRNAYNAAMKAKLYDCVPVHGPQGVDADGRRVTAKAYACTNCMEFFAELSVAYHYTLGEDEYNKWFPHNRAQLLRHDPASFAVLDRVWRRYD